MPRASMREQLIEAASDRFHEHGFNATGIKDITDAAGTPKGSFYNHFESKESMALEVMRRYSDTREMAMLADTSVAPVERMRRHFAHLRADLERFGYARGCMFGNFATELSTQSTVIRDQVGDRLERWETLLGSVLDEARAAGAPVAEVESATLARFLVSAWEGAAMRAKVLRSGAPLDDFFAVFDSLTA
ncbi:TetR/AcrR family transcriptional regulator [Actinacidiphila rubida]|uniref:Transcriptional regulator, TetR family n=1 Tax=Actinacidiphila rubida TaxID=310780 RepID=A0A1H8JBU1_9ACTN|nr:TetR/AcrR family transcriptional regulator [Actinacidiphila rubida]SEN77776.1 transcriptional regulator, TetR family [Actinacidiphila rubida]